MIEFQNSVLMFFALCLWCIGCGSAELYDPPRNLTESLQSFDLLDGFAIEALATEPEVMDPVDLVFDEFGRIYVVEMPDYPFKPAPCEGKGRIRQGSPCGAASQRVLMMVMSAVLLHQSG